MLNRYALLLTSGLLVSGVANAQDMFLPIPPTVGSMMFPVVANPCPSGRCPALQHGTGTRGITGVPSKVDNTVLEYNVTNAAAQEAQAAYLVRLRKNNPEAATNLSKQLQIHNFGRIFSNMVQGAGLHRGNIADVMAAYTILGWKVANADLADGPNNEVVKAVRDDIAVKFAAEPKFASAATRAALGEEIVISFVTLHAGWQSARREGKLQQYSDGVAAMFQKQTGNDLRQLVLTDRGLEKRG